MLAGSEPLSSVRERSSSASAGPNATRGVKQKHAAHDELHWRGAEGCEELGGQSAGDGRAGEVKELEVGAYRLRSKA